MSHVDYCPWHQIFLFPYLGYIQCLSYFVMLLRVWSYSIKWKLPGKKSWVTFIIALSTKSFCIPVSWVCLCLTAWYCWEYEAGKGIFAWKKFSTHFLLWGFKQQSHRSWVMTTVPRWLIICWRFDYVAVLFVSFTAALRLCCCLSAFILLVDLMSFIGDVQ